MVLYIDNMKQKLPLILIFTLSVIGVLAKFTQILTPGSFIPNSSMPISQADTAWMLTSSALVLLMTPGLSFFYGGMVGKKNVISTLFQSFAAMGVISLLWITVGFSLSFGESIGGFIGNPFSYLMMHNVGGTPNALFSHSE